MSDVNDESRHIESIDRFLTVCIERLQTETKTSDRFFTQTAFNNAIKEFVISEAKKNRDSIEELKERIKSL
jgi:hypothetical protein|tara:strand:- start:486 stop:698 length:213 start_codon:yes stop_codon:yes gene_type:complete